MNKEVALCIKNKGYEASLEKWKVYPVVGEEYGLLKVIDESGKAYLYPKDFFAFIELPAHVLKEITHEVGSHK